VRKLGNGQTDWYEWISARVTRWEVALLIKLSGIFESLYRTQSLRCNSKSNHIGDHPFQPCLKKCGPTGHHNQPVRGPSIAVTLPTRDKTRFLFFYCFLTPTFQMCGFFTSNANISVGTFAPFEFLEQCCHSNITVSCCKVFHDRISRCTNDPKW